MLNSCPFCDSDISKKRNNGGFICECPNCGEYPISIQAYQSFPKEERLKKNRHLFSGYIREMNKLGRTVDLITSENYESILSDPMIPKTLMEKLDKLLLYIYREMGELYQEVEIVENTPAIAYAKSNNELDQMLQALIDMGFVDHQNTGGNRDYSLTLEGIQRAERLQKEAVNSKQCFVAMWFDQSMLDIYNRYIIQAAQDAGYQSLIISQKEYNVKICDQIIAEIRRSKFLIADFTGHRGGVYFEAGFALGLGLPVIWTCRKDNLENLHFDIRQYNFIDWETGEELQERLTNRIQATIL